jgi:hypothetical protein
MTKKWERKVIKPKNREHLEKTIAAYAAKGWTVEVESMEAPGGKLTPVVFKRPKPSEEA